MTQTPDAPTFEAPEVVTRAVLTEFGVSRAQVVGRGRTGLVAAARKQLALELHARTAMSIADIGRFLDRDHTTVLYLLGRR